MRNKLPQARSTAIFAHSRKQVGQTGGTYRLNYLYPFGMVMPGREYRHGFNTQEKVLEPGSVLSRSTGVAAATSIALATNRIANSLVGNTTKGMWTGVGAFIRSFVNKLFYKDLNIDRQNKKSKPKVDVGTVSMRNPYPTLPAE